MTEEIKNELLGTVANLTKKPKGILAIDESTGTCNKRFEKLGVPTTEEKRRDYRDLLVSTPDIENYVSGYILFDETIRQSTLDGKSFVSVLKEKGIEPGIKVDKGLEDFNGNTEEKITLGLDGLEDRIKEYKELGATFAKWRSVYKIDGDFPSIDLMKKNAETFAEYALICQKYGIVPIVEPEVLYEGSHSIEDCYEVNSKNLDIVFEVLKNKGVFIPGILLKNGMILAGSENENSSPSDVAEMTIKCFKEHVSSDIGGIVFLSGGQTETQATLNLNAMHQFGELPWPLTFSYGRAIQKPALEQWAGNQEDIETAQKLLLRNAENNSLASVGKYTV